MKNIKLQTIEPNKNDKRPIAKFYRSYLHDVARGVSPAKCRGINQQQYRAADRLVNNYQQAFMNGGWDLSEVRVKKKYFRHQRTEAQVQYLREFNLVYKQLGTRSQAIIEHFCLQELPMREYELKQIPQWQKGVGTARLREALDELVEIYRRGD